jgi:hypothetical protein
MSDRGVFSCAGRDFANYPKYLQQLATWDKSLLFQTEPRAGRRETDFGAKSPKVSPSAQRLYRGVMSDLSVSFRLACMKRFRESANVGGFSFREVGDGETGSTRGAG